MVNKFLKSILIFVIFFNSFSAFSQIGKYKLVSPAINSVTVELHLFIDGNEAPFYADMLKDLAMVPLEELDDAIILAEKVLNDGFIQAIRLY